MSDAPQGPGWWQASDDKWYPPPRPAMPGDELAGPPAGMPSPASGPDIPPAPGFGAPMGAPGPYSGAPGPYSGAPVPGHGGGTNRTPLYVAIGIVVAVALVGGLILATSGGDDEGTVGTTTTSTQETASAGGPSTSGTDTTSGGSAGGNATANDLEVVDSGFSNYPAAFDDTNHVSYGYIIKNNSDEPAAGIEVTIALLDADGTVVSSDSASINYLAPGASIGQGDEPYEEIPEVAEIQVQAAIPSYASEPSATGELTTEGISTTDDGSTLTTTFTVSSTYDVQLDGPYGYVIYRNAAGDIIGGSYDFLSIVQAGGTTSAEVSSYELIPDVDPAQTEAYVDPGYL
ncbi:MAG TPA: FxLYD domain-containing protein [Acidimicrobiales bacterium]|nr:FxLYD domain-containing protein [Acidimicrobiales bacterium]